MICGGREEGIVALGLVGDQAFELVGMVGCSRLLVVYWFD
jgi:hypothetical protein